MQRSAAVMAGYDADDGGRRGWRRRQSQLGTAWMTAAVAAGSDASLLHAVAVHERRRRRFLALAGGERDKVGGGVVGAHE